jgi:hypothetical protein
MMVSDLLVLLADDDARTADSTGSAGGDETDLLTGGGITSDSRRLTDMLMVTTTVGMLDGVLGDTTNLGPAVALHAELVVGAAGLEHGLVDSSTASNEAEARSVLAVEELLDAGWELHSGSAGVGVVRDDGAVTAGGLCDLAAVASLLLERADDGTFWHVADRHDVTDVELRLLAAVDELAGADALWRDHGLGDLSVLVRVLELNLGDWRAAARVVADVLDETLDEALSLGKVERAELGGALSSLRAGGKDRASTLTLALDNASHVF